MPVTIQERIQKNKKFELAGQLRDDSVSVIKNVVIKFLKSNFEKF